jgi:cytochrome c peroxidase
VIEHYNWSVRPHPNLDSRLDEISAQGLALPEREKVALTEFLKTLTDYELISDPKLSDPFVR